MFQRKVRMSNHPCFFCGASTDLMEIPNIKMAGFFLRPFEAYSVCKDCHIPLSEGNMDGLIEVLNKKWNAIKERRKSEKDIAKAEKTKINDSRGVSVANSPILEAKTEK